MCRLSFISLICVLTVASWTIRRMGLEAKMMRQSSALRVVLLRSRLFEENDKT